ncbi:histidine kinase-like ATPase [Gigaspora rosea]|uniref:histidine kinase n=1 Tax=Gigaspora rosea TaxID=44941 RepID=A0A397VK11_9GLOM|nr:histidine kinase-like ATPase [Gigaspora rosea]
MEFLQLITNQMNIYLLHGKTIEEEKKRSKLLADLNYQKVAFFQGISHELKTPLTLMLSPLDSVINVCPRETSMTSYLQTIRRSAHRLLKLINNLLQFSNIEANQLEAKFRETNITEFTRELASDFKNMAKTLGLDYIIDIPHSDEFNQTMDDKIYLDHDMYETIIYNLCSNAIKHTWNGCITIRLYIDYKDNKRMAVLEVSDTGVGIPETALPNIFQRFYRVESQGSRSHEGTGIGLALVKEFVTCHGGNITVDSIVNRGTTFRCWFPIGCEHLPTNQIYINNVENLIDSSRKLYTNRQLYLEESSQWIKNSSSKAQHEIMNQELIKSRNINNDDNKILEKDDVSEKYHVLIVDDNNNMRDYLAVLLREFIIYRACDGQHALQVLKKLKKLPDLILSDVMMPNMDGYELLDALRTNVKTQLIPVILLSAKVGEDSKIKGLDKGADDYLLKPFSTRELISRIRTNIKLSIFRRKILFQQYKQEATKQLLLSISSKIFSKSNLDETLQYIVKEIYHILPCERIFIISNERSDSKNNKMVVSYEDSKSITPITNPFMEMDGNNKNESQTFIKSQEYNNSGIDICMDIYCDYVHKNVSVLSVELWLNNDFWGWIKVHRSSNSIWFDSEIELLQQISNQISLAITCAKLSEENTEKEIQIKAAEVANTAKSQILANTSHELRTPLGAIVGILTSFESAPLTADQKSMINIMGHASDIVLSIINDILDAAKLEAQKITLINRTFDLLELFESIIEKFGKKAGDKKIELIVNYDDQLPRYVKSDPDRLKRVLTHLLSNSVKFTDKGEILIKISMQSHETDENRENQTYSKIGKKGNLLIELYDTGIGMDPKYVQHAWKSFSQGDMSITKKQDGTGLGLSICKSLVEINGGEINVESQLGKGSKFWFTWNFEFLSSLLDKQFDDQMCCTIRQKRILIIHPVENVRNTMLKYLKRIKKVDAFDTFDKAIREAKKYKELFNIFAYDIAFISLYENNEEEVLKAALNLRKLEMNHNNLVIVFIVFPNEGGIKLAKKMVAKVGGATSILYTPITLKKLTNQFIFMEKNETINNNNKSLYINNNENIIKQVTDYNLKTENANQENTYECNPNDSEIKTTNATNNKFIISVDDGYIENTLISKFQNLAIKQSLQK